jgi:hypothetical protein
MRAWDLDPNHRHLLFPENMRFEEVELRPGARNVAVDFSQHPAFTFDEFWQLAKNKIVWMGPEIFFKAAGEVVGLADFRRCFGYGPPLFSIGLPTIVNTGSDTDLHVCSGSMTDATTTVCDDVFQLMTKAFLYFRELFGYEQETSLDTGWDNELRVYSRSVTDATTAAACDCVFQLMTRSNTIWTHLKFNVLSSVSTPVLSEFLRNSHYSGGNIRFGEHNDLSLFSQKYLPVFRDVAGPNHRLELQIGLGLDWSPLQTETVASFFQSCQCAVHLYCHTFSVPSPLVIDALSGECSIVDLRLDNVPNIYGLVRALAKNKSLVRLAFADIRICDDNWKVLCQSLATHPKLEYLRLSRTFAHEPDENSNNERKSRRTNVFLKMLQANYVLQELETRTLASHPHDEFDERIMSVIQPFLRVRIFAGKHPSPEHSQLFARLFARVLPKVAGKYPDPEHARLFARAFRKLKLVSPELTWMLIRSNLPIILEFSKGD